MTPPPQQPAVQRGLMHGALCSGVGILLLAALFLPTRDPLTRGLALEWRP